MTTVRSEERIETIIKNVVDITTNEKALSVSNPIFRYNLSRAVQKCKRAKELWSSFNSCYAGKLVTNHKLGVMNSLLHMICEMEVNMGTQIAALES